MKCREVGRLTGDVARRPAETLPAPVREHLVTCPACRRRLEAARLAAALIQAAGEPPKVPEGFAGRIMAALPRPSRQIAQTDIWRPAWGLIPAFTAAAIALLFVYQTSVTAPASLTSLEELSASEQLILHGPTLGPDQVLGAVLGGDAP
ncbi:MAG TPA: hypothetical protein VMG58_04065 [Candidatus Sulfotelmatobacter sp.]|nr:hypothetical protein [Candidatus Sulfotelmatobacter sp.]